MNTVIWCTGFRPDYGWVKLPVFDDYGYPVHDRGVVEPWPGLYFMGLLFQRTLGSALLVGVGRDAEYIARHIEAQQQGSPHEKASHP